MQGLLTCANQIELLFVDRETQLVCRKSKHSLEQICLPRNCFVEAINAADDHRLSGHPGCEKTILTLKRFFFGLECINGYNFYRRVAYINKSKRIETLLPMRNWEKNLTCSTLYKLGKKDLSTQSVLASTIVWV